MTEDDLIIEAPELQSFGQRVSALFVSLCCWSLWIYFLVPLVSLCGWLLGMRSFSSEVRWFGGYKSLIELLQIYALTIFSILMVWLLWTWLSTLLKRATRASSGNTRTIPMLVITEVNLSQAKEWKALTVAFNNLGQIIQAKQIQYFD
jgi:poly-beta-1,6-N-acetyl-D-glucosamine biosynthesis protein PgaD